MNPRLPLFMFCADKNNKTSTGLRKTLSVSCGRDDGVLRVRGVRWEWTYARGIRVCCGACAVTVEMYVSYSGILLFVSKMERKVSAFAGKCK